MTTHTLPIGLALTLTLASIDGSAHADPGPRTTVAVGVYDYAGVDPGVLRDARRQTARIFSTADVAIHWCARDEMPELVLSILSRPKPAAFSVLPNALGMAPAGIVDRGHIAYAFEERIAEFAGANRMSLAHLLGAVMAHELGHLLLPFNAHSETGIMRGNWDRRHLPIAAGNLVHFTADQSALLRQRAADLGNRTKPQI